MEPNTKVQEFARAIKVGGNSILIKGWLLEMTLRNLKNPLRLLVVLLLSSIAGCILAAVCFALFFFSQWILMFVGLCWMNDESINLWPVFFFCVKVGTVLPPVVICGHWVYALVAILACGGGFSALRKIRHMTFIDMPSDTVAVEMV